MKKDKIRDLLREATNTNLLGVTVTKPDQILYIMKGISGSGKSTKAKSLVGGGKIHSTDDLIDATGDYSGFFKKMNDTGNFSDLSRMHSQNLKNAIKSMEDGVSPIVIDNTNLSANEAKGYVMAALNLGFSDSNIKIIDVGTGGKTAEELAKRNSHGVPLETINKMISKYKSSGDYTLKDIVDSKDLYKQSDVLFSAVVLDDKSKSKLYSVLANKIPKDWKIYCHHMTIVFGKPLPTEMKEDLGKPVNLIANEIGISDMAIAVKVDGYPTKNNLPHITVAVNVNAGGKPVMSNEITNWTKLETPISLSGIVTEVKK